MRKLKDFDFEQKKVLVRCDFNVPLSPEGEILDDFRIRKTLPTINYLIKEKAKVILMSHLDDPGGKIVENLKLDKIQERLTECLNLKVFKAPDCIGHEVENLIRSLQPGKVLLLENLRFHKGEEENDDNFAKELVKFGDIFINDAFGACHRTHASIVGLPKYLPSGIGFLLEEEIKILSELLKKPKKPLIGIIGGKKVETKSKVIDKISEKADWILTNYLIKKEIEEKKIKLKYPKKIISPIDHLNTFDIGPKTINLFKEKISKAKTIFWSGPLGKIEEKNFQEGSSQIAKAIAESGAFSVVGGGETVEFINEIGLTEKFNHVSTGGGAMLEFLAGEELPGLKALNFYARD